MPKQKKKRTKKYTGDDAKSLRPTILRVKAVHRSTLGQWYFERKPFIKRVTPIAITILVIVVIIIGLIQLFI